MSLKQEKYRFDNAYEKVYELTGECYAYLTNYISASITKEMSYKEAERAIEQWKEYIDQENY